MMSSKMLPDSLDRFLVTSDFTAEKPRSLAEEETGVASKRAATAYNAACWRFRLKQNFSTE